MSSKRAMRQAQKQAYAKHRSNITNSRFEVKKKFLTKKKMKRKVKISFDDQTFPFFYMLKLLRHFLHHLKLL